MSFKPISSGLFNCVTVTKRLREVWAAIDELRELAGNVKDSAETVTKDSAETVIEVVAEVAKEVADEAIEDAFDWRECDDAAQLKEWALDTLDYKITGNKKADTIRKEIKEFLNIED